MTNTKMLNQHIDECGLKRSKIAQMLGISRNAFWRKINNKCEFKASEICLLCDVLKITKARDKEMVFFAPERE